MLRVAKVGGGEDERSPWELILRLTGLNGGACEVDPEGRVRGIPTRACEDGKVKDIGGGGE